MSRGRRILITGGGTGGHVYPGLAVAEALGEVAPDVEVRFAGTRRGLESVLVPRAGYRLHTVPASGLRGLGAAGRFLFLGNLLLGTLRSLALLTAWRPDMVLGTGGYVCGPVMLAAKLLGIPCALQEQNAIPGSANRLVARWAQRIYLGFAAAAEWFKPGATVVTGNPVRAAFAGIGAAAATRSGPARVLVFGGSRGAHTLNLAVAGAATIWNGRDDLALWVQTGPEDHAATVAALAGRDADTTRVVPYIEAMPEALAWADLVVCRAGAMTLAELQAAGRAALLVPFPFATDDHQRLNAEACAAAGAAVVLLDADCDGRTLAATVDELLGDRTRLATMGRAARALARPRAAHTIALDVLQRAGHPAGLRAAADSTARTDGD